ncbi:hypothetical protein J6590_022937 [Homalodisca vitripennis]|nr:hypothetical protein J6590_022937 [Homalodisca vitripennis]
MKERKGQALSALKCNKATLVLFKVLKSEVELVWNSGMWSEALLNIPGAVQAVSPSQDLVTKINVDALKLETLN